jgi:hypothetical protein
MYRCMYIYVVCVCVCARARMKDLATDACVCMCTAQDVRWGPGVSAETHSEYLHAFADRFCALMMQSIKQQVPCVCESFARACAFSLSLSLARALSLRSLLLRSLSLRSEI